MVDIVIPEDDLILALVETEEKSKKEQGKVKAYFEGQVEIIKNLLRRYHVFDEKEYIKFKKEWCKKH